MFTRPIATAQAWVPAFEQSVICDGGASMTRTFTSTSGDSWAIALRRSKFGATQNVISSTVYFDSSDRLVAFGRTSTRVFRDIGWYVFLFNPTSMYVNGPTGMDEVTGTGTYTMASIVNPVLCGSASRFEGGLAGFWHGDSVAWSVSDFVGSFTFDGQSLPTAESPSLSYGADGVRLLFADTANFGDDTSGNGNDWTPTGFVAGDQTADVPGRPLNRWNAVDTGSSPAIQEGGRRVNGLGAGDEARSFLTMTTGKFYAEFAFGSGVADGNCAYGVAQVNRTFVGPSSIAATPSWVWMYRDDGLTVNNGSSTGSFTNYGSGQRLAIAVDADAGDVWFGLISGSTLTWEASGNPAAGTGAQFSGIDIGDGLAFYANFANGNASTYFDLITDPAAFAATPPTGFLPLSADNLPTPTVDARNWFAVNTRTGTGATYSVTNGPANGTDLVWTKGRSGATDHALYDIVRGVQQQLESNTTTAETTEATGLTAFNSTGYTAGALAQMNTSAATYVDWMWKAGGAGVANTDGTISSTVSVAAPGHFGIGEYTATGVVATVGHGLGGVPELIVTKATDDATYGWGVYNQTSGAGNILFLNTTAGNLSAVNAWNNTAPTSTVFTLGTDQYANFNTKNYVFYAFRSIPGLCKVGSYTGNGSADGPLIDLGFKARWIMVKRVDSTASWYLHDTARSPDNPSNEALSPDLASAEVTSNNNFDILSSGFKARTTGAWVNASGGTYIYLALAELAGGGDLPWPLAR